MADDLDRLRALRAEVPHPSPEARERAEGRLRAAISRRRGVGARAWLSGRRGLGAVLVAGALAGGGTGLGIALVGGGNAPPGPPAPGPAPFGSGLDMLCTTLPAVWGVDSPPDPQPLDRLGQLRLRHEGAQFARGALGAGDRASALPARQRRLRSALGAWRDEAGAVLAADTADLRAAALDAAGPRLEVLEGRIATAMRESADDCELPSEPTDPTPATRAALALATAWAALPTGAEGGALRRGAPTLRARTADLRRAVGRLPASGYIELGRAMVEPWQALRAAAAGATRGQAGPVRAAQRTLAIIGQLLLAQAVTVDAGPIPRVELRVVPGPTRVPRVAGLGVEGAGERICGAGLRVRFEVRIAPGRPLRVLGTIPAAGTGVAPGSTVVVLVSRTDATGAVVFAARCGSPAPAEP